MMGYLMMSTLSSCESVPQGTNDYCLKYEPICASNSDAEETLQMIDVNNNRYEKFCEREIQCKKTPASM